MNKLGQFYLIAAIVFAGVIIGISAISNYSKKEGSPGINEIRDEIKIEGEKTLDYGINNAFTDAEMYLLFQNFTNHYISYEGRGGKSLYFLFGRTNNMTISGYQETEKVVSLSSASSQITVTSEIGNFTGSFNPNANQITLNIGGNPYNFSLSSKENFYFVITQETDGGDYIVTG